jgi:hypothetical protein
MNMEKLKSNEKFKQVTRLLETKQKEDVLKYLEKTYKYVYMKQLSGRYNNHIVFDCRFYNEDNELKSTFRDLWTILADIYYPYYDRTKHYVANVNTGKGEIKKRFNLKDDGSCSLKAIHVYNKKDFSDHRQENKQEKFKRGLFNE